MKNKARVRIKRMFPAYTKLRGVAYRTLRSAEEGGDSRDLNCMVSMLFSALCLEAFLNHLGKEAFEFWDEMERQLSPENKLRLIAKEQSYELDFSTRPFQTFREIFKFRNWIVHASTEELTFEGEIELDDGERPPKPLTKWEKLVDLQHAQRFSEDTKEIIGLLHGYVEIPGKRAFLGEIVETATEYLADSDSIE